MGEHWAIGVDADLKHGAIVEIAVTGDELENAVITSLRVLAKYTRKSKFSMNEKTEYPTLIYHGQLLANEINSWESAFDDKLPIVVEWDKQRVHYKGARRTSIVQVSMFLGSFLSSLEKGAWNIITPAYRRRVLNVKALTWNEFSQNVGVPIVVKDLPEIDQDGDVTDAASAALYWILKEEFGEKI